MTELKIKNRSFSQRNFIFLILFFLLLIYPPSIQSRFARGEVYLKGDCFYYRAVIISLSKDHDLLLGNNVSGTNLLNGQLAIGKEGLVPKHPIIMPIISMPFYLLLGDRGLLLFNVVDCLILIILIFKLNCLFFDPFISFITTILYAVGTLLFDCVYSYSPDIFSSVLLLASLYFIFTDKLYRGALFLGLSIFAKITNAPLVGIIFIYVLLTYKKSSTNGPFSNKKNFLINAVSIAKIIAVFIISLIPFMYTNYLIFGSPIITGYQQTAIADAVTGQMILASHIEKFNQPLITGAYNLLFAPINGIILTNPILILSFAGIIRLRKIRKRKETYLILLICFAQFAFFAKYDLWNASEFSNRFLITLISLSSVFTSSYLDYASHKTLHEIDTSA